MFGKPPLVPRLCSYTHHSGCSWGAVRQEALCNYRALSNYRALCSYRALCNYRALCLVGARQVATLDVSTGACQVATLEVSVSAGQGPRPPPVAAHALADCFFSVRVRHHNMCEQPACTVCLLQRKNMITKRQFAPHSITDAIVIRSQQPAGAVCSARHARRPAHVFGL